MFNTFSFKSHKTLNNKWIPAQTTSVWLCSTYFVTVCSHIWKMFFEFCLSLVCLCVFSHDAVKWTLSAAIENRQKLSLSHFNTDDDFQRKSRFHGCGQMQREEIWANFHSLYKNETFSQRQSDLFIDLEKEWSSILLQKFYFGKILALTFFVLVFLDGQSDLYNITSLISWSCIC